MADASERIIILSAVVLVIILWIPNSGLIQTRVTIDDLEIEIVTSRDNYTLGENFTANVYLVNTRSRDVWMEPIQAIILRGDWEGKPAWGEAVIDFMNDTLHIPSKSKVFLVYRRFTPIITGEFIIQCGNMRKTVLILDPDKEVPMPSFDISDLLDPELALSHGFKGYIDISYVSKIPDRVNVTSEKMINYTIQLELIPHVPEFTETEVLLSPENERAQFGILSSGTNLNEYIHYSPNGFILLRVDEPRNVTMILSVPKGFRGISEYPQDLLGVGIFADVPIASAYGAGIHRIPRDEYAWITATVLTVEPSPILDIIVLSSEEKDIPSSLFKAIDKTLPEDESVYEGEQITDVPIGERRLAISIVEAESIIHYFGEELEKDRLYYEYYVSYVDSIFSVLIQFHLPDPTS
jgi:hypothetical protein